jgi:acetoin utilization deacetylase AcuC-like enzyme
MTTILYHPFSKLHNPTYNHPDNPARIDAILEAIKPYRTQRPLRPATFKEIARVYTPDYIRSVRKQQGQKGSAGPGAPLTEYSADAALWSAGAAIEAADVAMSGNTSISICRPGG